MPGYKDPPKEHQIKPGEVRNPKGYSRNRRISDRLAQLIEEEKLDKSIAITFLGAALGDEKLLKGRKPNAAFFAMLLDRLEGKVTDKIEITTEKASDQVAEFLHQSEKKIKAKRQARKSGKRVPGKGGT